MIDTTMILLVVALAAPADSTAPVPSPTDSVIATLVSAQVHPGDELRVHGGFDQVRARVSAIGPDGLDLLLSPRGLTEPAPKRSLSWSEIDRIERGSNRRKDGQRIGVVLGAFFGLALTMSWISNAYSGEAVPLGSVLILGGGAAGALAGRSAGGAVGAGIVRWTLVYERR